MSDQPYPLGRQVHFDQRSRAFGILGAVDRPPRSYTWQATPVVLDQGDVPACVGFSWAGEMGAKPVVIPVDDARGSALYADAQAIDRAEGRNYDGGATVLAGAKAVKAAGHMDEYRWAFGADQLATAVSWAGPAVIGIPWHQSMFTSDSDGTLHPDGPVVGGHAILVRGYSVKLRRFTLRNSWGPGFGRGGDCYIGHDDLNALLSAEGDACVPMRRRA